MRKKFFFFQRLSKGLSIGLLLTLLFVPGLFADFGVINAQDGAKQITGKITDASNDPLPGVTVLIKGSSKGAVSDIDGNFTLKASPTDVLVVSYVGYQSQEIAVGESTTINVTLKEDIIGLDEVVVTGYGVQKRSDVTGAIASVSSEKLTEIPTVGVDQALQGRAAGVNVSMQSGIPGGEVKINIRGIGSINQNDGPLVVVDGVVGSLTGLNPSDIQSIEILKDLASASIYGVSGGNGVILVTTKKGQSGKMITNFNYYRGYQQPWKRMDMMNSQEWAKMQNIVNIGRGQQPFSLQPDTLPYYDWQDMMFKTSIMDNYDLSFSGGSEKSTYFISGNYQRQNGILEKSDFNQMNLRINSDHKVTKYISVGENVNFNKRHSEGFEEWQFRNEYNTPLINILRGIPFDGDYDENGKWIMHYQGYTNPRVATDVMDKNRDYYSVGGNFYINLTPIKGLVITSKINSYVNFNISDNFIKVYQYNATVLNSQSSYEKNIEQKYGWEAQNFFNYNFTLASSHNIGIMGGIESKYDYKTNMNGKRYDLINNSKEMHYFSASTNQGDQEVTGAGEETSIYSYFGRLNYDYKGKYLLSTNLRRDVSSRFGPQYRKGTFSAFSVGWKFSEESFMKNQNFLSFGKIRVGYGVTGANAPKVYGYYNSVVADNNFYNYIFDGSDVSSTGASIARLPNNELHWEKQKMTNIGADLGFLENRLNITAEWYRRRTEDMILNVDVPGDAGIYIASFAGQMNNNDPRPLMNAGSMNNDGIEFTADYKMTIGGVKANIGGNFSILNSKVTDIAGDTMFVGSVGINFSNICRTIEGEPMSQFYGYQTEGLFRHEQSATNARGKVYIWDQPYTLKPSGDTVYAQSSAVPGDFKFKDVNGDGKITPEDRVVLGSPLPKFVFGINLNLEYKGIDFSLFLEGKFGQKIFNSSKYYYMTQNENGNKLKTVLDQYYEDVYDENGNLLYEGNTDTDIPRLSYSDPNKNFSYVSDYYIEDGSYVRLRNLQLGYTIPNTLMNKIGVDKLRIYVGVKNLLTWTKYSGFDPEVGSDSPLAQGIDRAGGYPQSKMYMFGLNLQF